MPFSKSGGHYVIALFGLGGYHQIYPNQILLIITVSDIPQTGLSKVRVFQSTPIRRIDRGDVETQVVFIQKANCFQR